jgi:hypothetical protein
MRTVLLVLAFLLFHSLAYSQIQFARFKPLGPPLSYEESSSGLEPPALDGGPIGLEFGDVNADGFVDLVSIGDHGSPNVGTLQHGVMVWFGNGTGANWSVFMNGEFGYGGVALGDVNGDGHMDVGYGMHHAYSSTDFGDDLLEVALGDGSGRIWSPWDDGLTAHGPSWGMFDVDFADVDVDGDLDVVSISFGSGDGLAVYLNNGDGTWTLSFVNMGGNSSCEVLFGDFNGDGYPDIGAGHQSGTVFMGDGAGNFTNSDGNLPPTGSYGNHWGPDFEDIDGDGSDEVSFCTSAGSVEVWTWTGLFWQSFKQGLPSASDFDKTQLADMNMDGRVDLVTFGKGTVKVWQYDATGVWHETASVQTGSPGYAEALRVCDVDFNGRPDIALVADEGAWPSSRNHLHFYRERSKPRWPRIRMTHPAGGESFHRGAVVFIDWICAVPGTGGGASKITLELSTSGPAGPWSSIAVDVPDNNRYQWLIPSGLPASNDCHFRVTLSSPAGSDTWISKSPFILL